jgi:hypothetical protein
MNVVPLDGAWAAGLQPLSRIIGSSLVARPTGWTETVRIEVGDLRDFREGERRDSNPRPPGPQPGVRFTISHRNAALHGRSHRDHPPGAGGFGDRLRPSPNRPLPRPLHQFSRSAWIASVTAPDEIQSCAGARSASTRSCICGRAPAPPKALVSMHHTSVAERAGTGTGTDDALGTRSRAGGYRRLRPLTGRPATQRCHALARVRVAGDRPASG